MTPKEKAKDLFDRYYELVSYPTPNWRSVTKQCALIAVDELLFELDGAGQKIRYNYYQEVKQEIEKL
jgi:hypothetical protein